MLIYKITNLINNKIYIGKTIRTMELRWQEHVRDSKTGKTPLYLAMQKYGINNFKIETINDNIDSIEQLNALEKYYINKYQSTSHKNGYNVASGGDGGRILTKLTEQDVQKIIKILSDPENLLSYSDIGKMFNMSSSAIKEINLGHSWFQPNLKYPIRNYDTIGLSISKSQYKRIIDQILFTSRSLKDIAKEFNLSERQITAINQGYQCYNNNNAYYQGIYTGEYPLRKDNRIFSDNEKFMMAIKDIIFTNLSMEQIGQKYGIKGNTLTYLQRGQRHKELTKGFLVPLRQFQKENQEIFLKKGESSL